MVIRVFITDDPGVVRQGLHTLLSCDPDLEVVGEASNGSEAVHRLPEAAARLMREVHAPESPEALAARETEVLMLLARGKANKQIASALYVSEKTVKAHVSKLQRLSDQMSFNTLTQALTAHRLE